MNIKQSKDIIPILASKFEPEQFKKTQITISFLKNCQEFEKNAEKLDLFRKFFPKEIEVSSDKISNDF